MNLHSSHYLNLPRTKVYEGLTNPSLWPRCIEGCEKIVTTGRNTFEAHLKINLPVLKGNYVVAGTLLNLLAPASMEVVLEGKVRFGSVRGSARLSLEDLGDRTEVKCQGEAHFGGILAPLRSRINEATARSLVESFLNRLAQELGQGSSAEAGTA